MLSCLQYYLNVFLLAYQMQRLGNSERFPKGIGGTIRSPLGVGYDSCGSQMAFW
jgi:hypothetical protein